MNYRVIGRVSWTIKRKCRNPGLEATELFPPLGLERKQRRKVPIQQAAWRGAITFRQETEAASDNCSGESPRKIAALFLLYHYHPSDLDGFY